MKSQTCTKKEKTKIWPDEETAESAENISAMKQNLNIHNVAPAISSRVVSRKSLELSAQRASNIRGRSEGLPQLEKTYMGDSLSYLDDLLVMVMISLV